MPDPDDVLAVTPTLFTLVNAFMGFLAILLSFQSNFSWAAGVILIAFLVDGMDGRIARLTDNVSEFGIELDSLADLISFGLAPALLAYNAWLAGLHHLNLLGYGIAFLYVCGAAMRLARFNAHDRRGEPLNYFNGMPTPAAAGVIVGLVFLEQEVFWNLTPLSAQFTITYMYLAPIMVVLLGYLMLSNHRYPQLKQWDWVRARPIVASMVGVPLLALAVFQPALTIALLFLGYLVLGFIPGAWRLGAQTS